MLFLKSTPGVFIYLFFNESATQSYIDRGHHHELAAIKQLKRGGQGGLSCPSLPLF